MPDILFLFLCVIAAYLAWKTLAKHLKADKKAFDQEVAWMEEANRQPAVQKGE